ncbi:MAG: hypothetical protein GX450_07585, partial [Verrucomicrobia bacterium]|nr:hypothetical protein [Verrucomicrobiota bacterium]
ISSSVGSFAIPIGAIVPSSTVQVVLSNTTAATLALTIPVDYWTNRALTLAPGESRVCGTFTTGATWGGRRNIGLRNITPPAPPAAPYLHLARLGADMQLEWLSAVGVQYQPLWSTNFQVWNNLTANPLNGTGTNLTCLDVGATAHERRFYRLQVIQP